MKSTQSRPSIVFCHGIWADGSPSSSRLPEAPRNNLLHSAKCGVYKTGHPGGQNGNPG
jgi:hypothetical protein